MASILLKLKYCPVCGSFVKRNFAAGLLYQGITWRCTNAKCAMSHQDKPLDGWNEANRPNPKTRILEIVRAVQWKFNLWRAERVIKKYETGGRA